MRHWTRFCRLWGESSERAPRPAGCRTPSRERRPCTVWNAVSAGGSNCAAGASARPGTNGSVRTAVSTGAGSTTRSSAIRGRWPVGNRSRCSGIGAHFAGRRSCRRVPRVGGSAGPGGTCSGWRATTGGMGAARTAAPPHGCGRGSATRRAGSGGRPWPSRRPPTSSVGWGGGEHGGALAGRSRCPCPGNRGGPVGRVRMTARFDQAQAVRWLQDVIRGRRCITGSSVDLTVEPQATRRTVR